MDLVEALQLQLLHAVLSLVGALFCSLFVDNRICGRWRLQIFGFFVLACVFCVAGRSFDQLVSEPSVATLECISYVAAFFSCFGYVFDPISTGIERPWLQSE